MQPSRGKRILMLLENNPYPRDGRVRREANALTDAGFDVTVICPASPGQPRREMVRGVRVYRYPEPRPGDGLLGYLWEYGYSMAATMLVSLVVLVRHGFDVMHVHNPPDTYVLIAAFYKLLGKRFVFDHHDLSPEMYRARLGGGGSRLVFQALVFFEKLTFRLADHVIATNQSYRQVALERGRVPADRVTVVRNGTEPNRVRLTAPDPVLREKAGTILAYVGVMGYQDGIDYLLRALKHLAEDQRRTDFYCILIGAGDARDGLIALSRELDLEDRVWFTGFIPDEEMIRCLSSADIFVDPDPSNPFNDRSTMIKMMEYMALGKPIVAFDLPEHRATARESALYARANDERDFAQCIAELMDDPQRRQRMGRLGCERIERELSWPHQVPRLLEAYAKLGFVPAAGEAEAPAAETQEAVA
jgi:glycosyltransferase involved in cell wall biosynthesis